MKRTVIAVTAAAILLAGFSAASPAQTINNILAKLQAVETRLKDLESSPLVDVSDKIESVELRLASYATIQKEKLEEVETKLEKLDKITSSGDLVKTVESLELRVDELQKGLMERQPATAGIDGERDERFRLLVADLGGLVTELRTSLERPAGVPVPEKPEEAPMNESSGAALFGFGDFFYQFGSGGDETPPINVGQVEVDLETSLDSRIDFAGAVAFDPDGGSFGLGMLYLDFRLVGEEGSHFINSSAVETAGLIVGQFDVPFGIDWLVYPSIDRKLVSGPLVVENAHDFWNDYGVQGYVGNSSYSATLFATNGFSYGEHDMRVAYGGRVSVTPLGSLEIGSSYATFLDGENTQDMGLLGFDVQAGLGALSVKGEYIRRDTGLALGDSAVDDGFYCQGMYDFGKYFVVGRYGEFTADGAESLSRISAGCGYVVREGLEFRVEHQVNSEVRDRTFVQMVVGL